MEWQLYVAPEWVSALKAQVGATKLFESIKTVLPGVPFAFVSIFNATRYSKKLYMEFHFLEVEKNTSGVLDGELRLRKIASKKLY